MPESAPTAREELARLRKAIKLADVLWLSVVHSSQLEVGLADPDAPWKLASIGAGFAKDYLPSHVTREVVIGLLKDREATAARLNQWSQQCQTT